MFCICLYLAAIIIDGMEPKQGYNQDEVELEFERFVIEVEEVTHIMKNTIESKEEFEVKEEHVWEFVNIIESAKSVFWRKSHQDMIRTMIEDIFEYVDNLEYSSDDPDLIEVYFC